MVNKKQKDIFERYVENVENYTLLSDYVKSTEKVLVRHDECGEEYWVRPSHFKNRGQRCQKCKMKHIKKESKNRFIDLLKQEGYSLSSPFIDTKKKVTIKHLDCGYVYSVKPDNFFQGKRCPSCYMKGRKGKSINRFPKLTMNNMQKDYNILSDFNGNREPITLKCKKCGRIFESLPRHFDSSTFHTSIGKCPSCYRYLTSGEKIVENFLIEKQINFQIQKSFSDLFFEGKLRFDFAIFDNNNNLLCLIEYQGEQHYRYVEFFFKSVDRYKISLQRDKMKREYCSKNNIPLIEIPYWTEDIPSFLSQKIKELGITYSLNT